MLQFPVIISMIYNALSIKIKKDVFSECIKTEAVIYRDK